MGIDPDSQNVVLYTRVERSHENRTENFKVSNNLCVVHGDGGPSNGGGAGT